MNEKILGLITGIIFGVLLQKSRALRFDKQVAAMRFKDMTILKFMMSAILVGMVGVAILNDMGIITLGHKPMNVGGILIGASIFGVGWAIAGYCPGTAIGALGEGRLHAMFVLLGMLVGAAVFAELYPFLTRTVLAWKDYGKIGWPETLGVSQWVVISAFAVVFLAVFALFERKNV